MPLVVVCGGPASGKSLRAQQARRWLESTHGKLVHVVSEEEAIRKLGYEKNETYLDSQKEKRVRGLLKSEVIRLIGKDNVVILDASNYIKGFRYEIYCASKASKCTQCTIYTIRNHREAKLANLSRRLPTEDEAVQERDKASEAGGGESGRALDGSRELERSNESALYTDEVFNALNLRFEEPNANSRWDSPLFTVQTDEPLDLDALYRVLFEKKPPPPNMSTQNPPLSSTNFLYELDRVTQAVSQRVLDSKRLGSGGVRFPEHPDCALEAGCLELVTPQHLLRLRRQFLTFAKMQHANESAGTLGRYYIQYLNKSLQECPSCFIILLSRYWATYASSCHSCLLTIFSPLF